MGLPSGQQVARLMGVTPLTNGQLSQNYRIEVRVPHRDNKVRSPPRDGPREFHEENPDLKASQRVSGMEGRGSAVVLHPEGGRNRRQGPDAGPGRRSDCGRGSRRPVAEGPQLVPVPESRLEASPPIAPAAGSSPWPTFSSTLASGRDDVGTINEHSSGKGTFDMRGQSVHDSPGRSILWRVLVTVMALAAILTLGACKATGGGQIDAPVDSGAL